MEERYIALKFRRRDACALCCKLQFRASRFHKCVCVCFFLCDALHPQGENYATGSRARRQ